MLGQSLYGPQTGYDLAMDRRRTIIYWQGLVAIWGVAIFFVYSEWNQVTVAVVAHLLWR